MLRVFAVLVGLAVLLGGGLVHGLWNDRWQPSEALADACARTDRLPTEVAGWKSEAVLQDPKALDLAGAASHYSRLFTDPATGDKVLVLLLCGKASRMVVHRPEHCFQAAGFEMAGPALRFRMDVPGVPPAELWTGYFARTDTTAPEQLRIFWTWLATDRWEAPDSPRMHYARQRALYKLYVMRNVTGPTAQLNTDPCVRLMGHLLPVLDRELAQR